MPQKSSFYILLIAVLLYLALLSPQFPKSPFTYDTFYNLWRAMKFDEDPLSIFKPTFATRFAPLYYLFLFAVQGLFGFNPLIYGLIHGILHILNAFLLFKLLRSLMGDSGEPPALLASIFFLFSSTQWGVIWELGQTPRLNCTLFSLATALYFARSMENQRKKNWALSLILFVAALGFSEDSITLPFLLLGMTFLPSPRLIRNQEKCVLTFPFFLISLIYFSLALKLGGPQGAHLHLGSHVTANIFSLSRELIQFLLIPRPEFVPFSGIAGILIRLLPGAFILLFIVTVWRWRFIDRFVIFGIAWLAIISIPYLFRPMPGVWQGRYLYLPAVGEAIVVGITLYKIGRSLTKKFLKACLGAVVIYGLGLNIYTLLFMIEKVRAGYHSAGPKELPVLYAITSAIRDHYGAPSQIPPDMVLFVENLPFPVTYLEKMLPTYYLTLPAMIIENREGRPSASIRDSEKYRILYLKWERGTLRKASKVRLSEDGLLDIKD